jgi:uncharacterized BrkB/YihY/UPF0761 family membrane protein
MGDRAISVRTDPAGDRSVRRRRLVDRVDHYQRRHPWLGLPLAVVYKFVDDQGGYLTALLTYYAFLSLFPPAAAVGDLVGVPAVRRPAVAAAGRR